MSDRNSQYTIILFAHLLNVNALGLALGLRARERRKEGREMSDSFEIIYIYGIHFPPRNKVVLYRTLSSEIYILHVNEKSSCPLVDVLSARGFVARQRANARGNR